MITPSLGQLKVLAFGSSDEYPCYIAMAAGSDGGGQDRKFYFHKAKSVEMCKFAERARETNQNIKIYASIQSDSNSVDSLEYARTKAKWWIEIDQQ